MNLKNKIFILTLGCPKNEIISEKIAFIASKKFQIADKVEDSDYVIINSCGFIEDALRETIEETLKLKKKIVLNNLKTKIILTGCATIPFKKDLLLSLKEADYIFDYEDLKNFLNFNDEILFSKRYNINNINHYKYLSISEGCSKNCTYCIIPKIKGEFYKFPENIILNEANELKNLGTKEIIIVSQDTLGYGLNLVDLMKKISEIDFPWIRMMYFNPDSWDDKFLEIFKIKNLLKYVEIPVQHLSNKILKKMGRKKTFDEIKNIILKIKDTFPEIAIRTTVIVGFPYEEKEDFEFLLNNITELPFDIVGTFIYSDMVNSPSYNYKNKVPQKEKVKRYNILTENLKDFHSKNMKRYEGKIYEMIIDSIESSLTQSNNKLKVLGRIYSQAPEIDGISIIENPKKNINYYKIGDFIKVKVIETIFEDLICEEI
jgi:ribosomal protein S12 methylthiotransferase